MTMRYIFTFFLILVTLITNGKTVKTANNNSDKARLIVTTDLGGADPDDTQSLIHLLTCADGIDLEGIISSPSWVKTPDNTSKIREIVDAYANVYENLREHSKSYPSSEVLYPLIVRGQSKPHVSGIGEGKDSPGSELIIKAVDKDDPRPIWLTAWGGMNTIAQAIWKVKNTRSEKDFERFSSKIRIYDVLGQDDAGAWIAKNFPRITYIRNDKIYGWAPDDNWTKNNIQNRGSFGAIYPDRIWATEGDSPAFLYLCANGLNTPEHPDYGGWGGRFDQEKCRNIRGMDFIVKSGKDEAVYDDYYMYGSAPEGVNAITLWKEELYNDFAARMIWSVTPLFKDANHHPTAILNGKRNLAPLILKAKAGKKLKLDAFGSSDPDGDALTYRWFKYDGPSSYKKNVKIDGIENSSCLITIPHDAAGKNIHIILTVSDSGTPKLSSYRRAIIEVK